MTVFHAIENCCGGRVVTVFGGEVGERLSVRGT